MDWREGSRSRGVAQAFGSQSRGGPLQHAAQIDGVIDVDGGELLNDETACGACLQEAFMGEALQNQPQRDVGRRRSFAARGISLMRSPGWKCPSMTISRSSNVARVVWDAVRFWFGASLISSSWGGQWDGQPAIVHPRTGARKDILACRLSRLDRRAKRSKIGLWRLHKVFDSLSRRIYTSERSYGFACIVRRSKAPGGL